MIQPPPGFELISDAPSPPPGFELMPPLELTAQETPAPAPAMDDETWGQYIGGLGLNAAQGLTFNYADEIGSAIGSLAGFDREELLADLRDAEKSFDTRHPVASTLAEVGGAIASGIPAGGGLIRAIPALGRAGGIGRTAANTAAISAPMGALSATGATEGDEPIGEAALYGGLSGAAWGGGLGAAGSAIGRTVGPWATDAAQGLRAAGVRLTPGELVGGYGKRLEDTLSSVPFVGAMVRNRQGEGIEDLNRAAVRQALAPDRVVSRGLERAMPNTEVGHELVGTARDLLSRRYGQVVPRMRADYDQALINDVRGIRATVPQARVPDFDDAIARWVDDSATFPNPATPNMGTIDGRGLQNALGGLRDEGRDLITSQASQAYNRDLGRALLDAREALVRAAERSTTNRTMGDFRRLERAYAGYARIRDAASRTGADQGTFTPAQLFAAVRSGDKSAGKGATATGEALLQDLAGPARSVMTRRVNDSGTPERAAVMGAILAPSAAATGAAAALPFAALYTPVGRAVFERLAAGSPQTRALLRQIIERYSQRAAPGAAAAFGG